MTFNYLLAKFPKEFSKNDFNEVARYNRDQAKYDSPIEILSEFLKRLILVAKQTLTDMATYFIEALLFGGIAHQLATRLDEQQQQQQKNTHLRKEPTFFCTTTIPAGQSVPAYFGDEDR